MHPLHINIKEDSLGRKVHPIGFRLGFIKDWQSKWYAERNYTEQLHQDLALRDQIARDLTNAGVAGIDIERSANRVEVTIHTAKPGIVIGKRGANVDALKSRIEALSGKKVKLNIQEIHQPELNAFLVAESIGEQISKRVSYKRAMKQATQRAMRSRSRGVYSASPQGFSASPAAICGGYAGSVRARETRMHAATQPHRPTRA